MNRSRSSALQTSTGAGGLPVATGAMSWNSELHRGPAPVRGLLGKEHRIASVLVTNFGGTAYASHNGC